MYLYSLTLQKPTGICQAIYGNFSAPKAQEILVARGKILELLRPDEAGKMHSVLSVEIFGVIRAIAPFRLTGGNKDFIVVGSDSGRIVILEYNPTKNSFDKVHTETFGKSGCRRIVPGQFLATDPKGRAIMIAAIEKQKFVYVINRDSAARLTISSPLEAHKSHTIVFYCCGVDVGFENPVFATLEVDYTDADQDHTGQAAQEANKMLVLYELDLGLNHVVRKWSDAVDNTANMIIPVPGGSDGPGGVIVCCENHLLYKKQDHNVIKTLLPRRQGQGDERGTLIISYSTHKQKELFFFLLQSEYGDLYKVTVLYEEENVSDVRVKYFDSLAPASSICVMKHGFLFVAAEFGNHALYQFQGIGEEDDAPEASSYDQTGEEGFPPQYLYFRPRAPKNLLQTDDIEALCPILDLKVADVFGEDTKQMYAACGRGTRSSLRILRHGLAVTEMAVSELPGNPNAVWTVKKSMGDQYDKYIIVSFVNATLVLSIGETVEEVTDTGFLATTPTLNVSLLPDDALLQVHPNGLRHIRSDRRVNEWKPPGKKQIVTAGVNNRQVVIAMSGGDLTYFEMDISGNLMEIERKDMGQEVLCVDVAPIPAGRNRSRFLAVGTADNTVRIVSLEAEDHMAVVATQALPGKPDSVSLIELESGPGVSTLYLNVGLSNGVLQRTVVDSLTGQLSDTRQRFLGSRGVKLFKVSVGGKPATLALSSRSWYCYTWQSRVMLTPLSYQMLEYASNFSSEQCLEGIVAISANTLRIVSCERLGEVLNQTTVPLRYTPRKTLIIPESKSMVIIESEHNRYTAYEQHQLVEATRRVAPAIKQEGEAPPEDDEDASIEAVVAAAKAGVGHWASCVRLLDIPSQTTLQLIEMDGNEAAISLCMGTYVERPGEQFVMVGTVKDLKQMPRVHSGGFIHVYKISDDRRTLIFMHKTAVDDVPYAIHSFQGRLLAGVGHVLRIYDLGKRKLLRKCETKTLPNQIVWLFSKGERIYIGDASESISFAKYKRSDNQLYVFADDTAPRWITNAVYLDYDTLAGADKFGNLFVLRLPSEVSDEVEDDPTGSSFKFDKGLLNGAPHKLENINNFFVGDMVTSILKNQIQAGAPDCVLYGTMMGSIGSLLPITSREDVDFFSHLEMHLRQENPPLCGRDHLSFRSYYFPVKEVIDGDLCETFTSLPLDKQKQIGDELDRTPAEVAKKLEDIRNLIL